MVRSIYAYSLKFLRKIKKTVKSDQQEPPKCGSTRGGVRIFYHMIRRLSSTLSRNKTLVIKFFFFKTLICLGYLSHSSICLKAKQFVSTSQWLFYNRLISTSLWFFRSPDLNPLDLCVWGMLKDKVYKTARSTLEDLTQRTSEELLKFILAIYVKKWLEIWSNVVKFVKRQTAVIFNTCESKYCK